MRKIPIIVLIIIVALWSQLSGGEQENTIKDDPVVAEIKALFESVGHFFADYEIDSAQVLCEKGLGLARENFKEPDTTIALALTWMGSLYYHKSDFARCENYWIEALNMRKKILPTDHLDIGNSMHNMSTVYRAQGKFADALPFQIQALEIRKKNLNPGDTLIADGINNLGAIYYNLGNYEKAESLFIEAIRIRENFSYPGEIPNDAHYTLSLFLGNLGRLHKNMGFYEKARPFYERALKITEETWGSAHPRFAIALAWHGEFYYEWGKYTNAVVLFKRAIEIYEKTVSPDLLEVTSHMNGLAKVLSASGKLNESITYYHRAQEPKRNFINHVFPYASEVQKLMYVQRYPLIDNSFLSLVQFDNTMESKEPALEMLLEGKGVVLEAISAEKKTSYCLSDSFTTGKCKELDLVGGEIATMIINGLGGLEPDEYKNSLDILVHRKDKLEAELRSICYEFDEALALREIRVRDVAEALSERSVLWEIIKYRPYDFRKTGSDKERKGPPRYMVFQLSKDGNIEAVDLGEAVLIDSLMVACHDNITNLMGKNIKLNEMSTEQELSLITGQLYDLVFAPMVKYLDTDTRIFISPDGELNLLPFNILRCPDGKYLIEKYEISYLSSGRDLVKFAHHKGFEGDNALVIAAPDFEFESKQYTDSKTDYNYPHFYEPMRGSPDLMECFTNPFNPLYASGREGRLISELLKEKGELQTDYYFGADASKEMLIKNITETTPRVLHLATHGYFCPKAKFSKGVRIYDNPLLYSGIILAGANRIILEEKNLDTLGIDNGILTSLEVSGFNLVGTDLVVLSACQTGVGEVKNGEGVFGLRRSFQHAGAQSIVMSMWSIPDEETVELMTGFYNNWLSGDSKSCALRKASLSILNERRKTKSTAHPLFWGGFILAGNPN